MNFIKFINIFFHKIVNLFIIITKQQIKADTLTLILLTKSMF